MREVAPDPGGYRFLVKALGEAGKELAEELFACPQRAVDRADDDGWTPRLIAAHVLAYEQMVETYYDLIARRRDPELPVIDTEAMRDNPDGCDADIEYSTLRFHHLRRGLQYRLWDFGPRDWERTGRHPYRGSLSAVQIARDLHLHDLDCLWRARRIRERGPGTGRKG